ncbi:MAG: hypothetical protein JRE71_06370 [Deltaproteobacteria bacterium]|nr:hypothetical protein [Deltaproteobacteria bacterium]
MPIAITVFVALLAGIVGAGLWQHFKYLKLRRERVEDRQPLFYPSRTFHAVTYLKLGHGLSAIDEVRALRNVVEKPGGGLLVYAGLVGMNMVASKQISNDWDALVLVQYASREAFDRFTATDEYREVLARFADTYTHGAMRGVGRNLALPLALLGMRVSDILRRKPPMLPYVPVGEDAMPGLKAKIKEAEQLDQYRHIKDDAVVIFNLIQPGDKNQQKADRSYSRQMISGMAEGSYGPMHMGKAVTVEGDASFKQFVVVYYPGIDHMHAMLGSTFMNRIGGGKQLGDSLAVATIPILSKL